MKNISDIVEMWRWSECGAETASQRIGVSRADSLCTHKQAKSRTEGSLIRPVLSCRICFHPMNTTPLLHGWLQTAKHCAVQVVSTSHWDEEVKEQKKTRTFTQPAAPTSGAQTSSSLLGSLESRCSSARHQPATQRNAQRE